MAIPMVSRTRLLLINPKFPESFWTFKWAISEILPRTRATNPPLGLATLAALTPSDWGIRLVDENVEPLPLSPEADIVGICGMGVQVARQRELAAYYRRRGYYVVVGGSYASLCAEAYVDVADTVVAGEAERTWRQFCKDYLNGRPRALYREGDSIPIAESPAPRFDLLKLDCYSNVSLQFSRGCPYRCEFCDIVVMFGRRPRTKTPEQIGGELDALRARSVRRVFFVDDNLIGDKPQAKRLLRYLADYQRRHDYWFSFGTEASLNLARDEELLPLFRAANFSWVFIGIETTDEESLKETRKSQNLGGDMLTDVRRLYTYGIDVLAGFIIGFDNDTLATFDRQRDFIMAAGIQSAMIGLLHALPRTPLYERLEREGRLRGESDACNNTRAGTNIVPKRMEYGAMVERYEQLYRELLTDTAIATRIREKMRFMTTPLYSGGYSLGDSLRIVWRVIARGILPGGPLRWREFLRTLPLTRPRQFPAVISDWIIGLSMADFVRRHYTTPVVVTSAYARRIAALRRALSRHAGRGAAALEIDGPAALSLFIGGMHTPRFFHRAGRQLERLLRDTPSTLTLRIDVLAEAAHRPLKGLLRRLHRYGDRVYLVVDERICQAIDIDSSLFNLVLERRPG